MHRLLTWPHAGFLTENDVMSEAEITREPLRQFWERFGLGSVIVTSFRLPTDEALLLVLTRSLERGTDGVEIDFGKNGLSIQKK